MLLLRQSIGRGKMMLQALNSEHVLMCIYSQCFDVSGKKYSKGPGVTSKYPACRK
jgi:hypothetical protein